MPYLNGVWAASYTRRIAGSGTTRAPARTLSGTATTDGRSGAPPGSRSGAQQSDEPEDHGREGAEMGRSS